MALRLVSALELPMPLPLLAALELELPMPLEPLAEPLAEGEGRLDALPGWVPPGWVLSSDVLGLEEGLSPGWVG